MSIFENVAWTVAMGIGMLSTYLLGQRDERREREAQSVVLAMLAQRPAYARDLLAGLDKKLRPRSIYTLLARMEDREMIFGSTYKPPEDPIEFLRAPARRLYSITDYGRRRLDAE